MPIHLLSHVYTTWYMRKIDTFSMERERERQTVMTSAFHWITLTKYPTLSSLTQYTLTHKQYSRLWSSANCVCRKRIMCASRACVFVFEACVVHVCFTYDNVKRRRQRWRHWGFACLRHYIVLRFYRFSFGSCWHGMVACYHVTGAECVECGCMNEALIVTDFIEIDLRFYFQFNWNGKLIAWAHLMPRCVRLISIFSK